MKKRSRQGLASLLAACLLLLAGCGKEDAGDHGLVASWDNEQWAAAIHGGSPERVFRGTPYGTVLRIYAKEGSRKTLVREYDIAKVKPWTIDGGDLEGDGILDLAIGAVTETEFYPEEKRPFFLVWDGSRLTRKWTGSYLGFSRLEGLWLEDVDGDGIDEACVEAVDETGASSVSAYSWGNFGFYIKE